VVWGLGEKNPRLPDWASAGEPTYNFVFDPKNEDIDLKKALFKGLMFLILVS